jgi:hypothetical protein
VILLSGILILGVGVFYQQQLTNAAREAARYAAVHSATSQCPTTSRIDPAWNRIDDPNFDKNNYYDCDPPELGWPQMTAFARSKVFGIDRTNVDFSACWSGYWDDNPVAIYDAPAIAEDGSANTFHPCTIGGIDPRTSTDALPCPPPATVDTGDPNTSDDKASNLAATAARTSNQVTVYACYLWAPPLGGIGIPYLCPSGWCSLEILPSEVTLRAVITEALQHQK